MKIIKTVTVKSSSYCILQSGRTPLHKAAASPWWSNKQVVETLIEAGADVNATNKVSYYQATLCNSSYNNNVVDTYMICTYVHSYMAKATHEFYSRHIGYHECNCKLSRKLYHSCIPLLILMIVVKLYLHIHIHKNKYLKAKWFNNCIQDASTHVRTL